MAEKEFRYAGSVVSGVTLGKREVTLVPGAVVSLPEESRFVARLVAQRLLVPVPPAAPVSKGARKMTGAEAPEGAKAPKDGE